MTREQAYIENPEMAMLTDFLSQNEKKLKHLYKKFKKDTGNKVHFLSFVYTIYVDGTEINENTGEREIII